ncbi:amino acid transporter, partial [Aliarcobacter trophiarum LMG 25534]
LGVGLLIQQSLWLFNLIKLAGAAYLIFLGIKMLRAKPATDEVLAEQPVLSSLGALRTGFLTNVLNPKTTIFIVSLFMQVVQPQTSLAVQLGYGAVIVLAHAVWFSAVAIFFSADSVRGRLLAVRHWIDRVFGGLLVGFGMLLALTQQSR